MSAENTAPTWRSNCGRVECQTSHTHTHQGVDRYLLSSVMCSTGDQCLAHGDLTSGCVLNEFVSSQFWVVVFWFSIILVTDCSWRFLLLSICECSCLSQTSRRVHCLEKVESKPDLQAVVWKASLVQFLQYFVQIYSKHVYWKWCEW